MAVSSNNVKTLTQSAFSGLWKSLFRIILLVLIYLIAFTLRGWQEECAMKLIESDKPNKLIVAPTGSGKSIAINYLISHTLHRHKTNKKIIICVPQKAIGGGFVDCISAYGEAEDFVAGTYSKAIRFGDDGVFVKVYYVLTTKMLRIYVTDNTGDHYYQYRFWVDDEIRITSDVLKDTGDLFDQDWSTRTIEYKKVYAALSYIIEACKFEFPEYW